MTAIKKTISKTSKSPAPATKVTPSASRKSAVAKAIAPAPVATARVSDVRAIKPRPVVTSITAKVDVGFGNLLFIRGEGPGLSWDAGIQMNCVGADEWQITFGESSRPIAFKLLVNDLTWSAGADFIVAPGEAITLSPVF